MMVGMPSPKHPIRQRCQQHDPHMLKVVAMHTLCSSLLDAHARRHSISLNSQIETLYRIVSFYVTDTMNSDMLTFYVTSKALFAASKSL